MHRRISNANVLFFSYVKIHLLRWFNSIYIAEYVDDFIDELLEQPG